MMHRTVSSGRYYLLRTDPDGTRHISGRVWVLVWLLPACFLGAALFLFLETLWIRETTLETTGTVVHVYEWENDAPQIFYPGEKVYSPLYEYTDQSGKTTRATAGTSHTEWNFPLGTEKVIRYVPDGNDDVVLAGPTEWILTKIIGIIGACLLPFSILGALILVRWKRAGRKPAGVTRL